MRRTAGPRAPEDLERGGGPARLAPAAAHSRSQLGIGHHSDRRLASAWHDCAVVWAAQIRKWRDAVAFYALPGRRSTKARTRTLS